jgi:hypothetical protein
MYILLFIPSFTLPIHFLSFFLSFFLSLSFKEVRKQPLPQITQDFDGFFARAVAIARSGSRDDQIELINALVDACKMKDATGDVFLAMKSVVSAFSPSFLAQNPFAVGQLYGGLRQLFLLDSAGERFVNSGLGAFLASELVRVFQSSFLLRDSFSCSEVQEINGTATLLTNIMRCFLVCVLFHGEKVPVLLSYAAIVPTAVRILDRYTLLHSRVCIYLSDRSLFSIDRYMHVNIYLSILRWL